MAGGPVFVASGIYSFTNDFSGLLAAVSAETTGSNVIQSSSGAAVGGPFRACFQMLTSNRALTVESDHGQREQVHYPPSGLLHVVRLWKPFRATAHQRGHKRGRVRADV